MMTMGGGGFDPALCPLLQHLPPEEQQARMRSNKAIARCVRMMGGVKPQKEAAAIPVVALASRGTAQSEIACRDCDAMIGMS